MARLGSAGLSHDPLFNQIGCKQTGNTVMTKDRHPSKVEISQERTLFWVLNIDGVDLAVVALVAVATGSLTLMADAARVFLTLLVGYFSLWIMHRKHRNRFGWLEFGSGKLERISWCVFGLAMIFGALLIAGQVANTFLSDMARPTSLERSVAAITRSVNLLINTIGCLSILALLRARAADVLRSQFHARSTMLGCSIVVQTTLTLSALSQTVNAGYIWDVVGAIFVIGLMLYSGWKMIARGLPDLLDAPVAEADLSPFKLALRKSFSSQEIREIKSRRSSDTIFVEITLCAEKVVQRGSISQRIDDLTDQLERVKEKFDVTLVAHSGGENR